MSYDVHHPLFGRLYARFSPKTEARGGAEHRRELLADLRGRVLELGAGNGLNFPYYPATVTEVVAVEPEDYLRARADGAAQSTPVRVGASTPRSLRWCCAACPTRPAPYASCAGCYGRAVSFASTSTCARTTREPPPCGNGPTNGISTPGSPEVVTPPATPSGRFATPALTLSAAGASRSKAGRWPPRTSSGSPVADEDRKGPAS